METGKKVPGIVQEGGSERQREQIKRRVRSSLEEIGIWLG